jgi:type IV pilus assembly protein PilC
MPEFKYKGIDRDQKNKKGTIKASNQEDALNELKREGIIVTSLKKKKEGFSLQQFGDKEVVIGKKVKSQELAFLSQQMSILLDSGIELIRSLEILETQVDNKYLQNALIQTQKDIKEGSSFYNALEEFPDIFPIFFRKMVKSGEMSGQLGKIFSELNAHYEYKNDIVSEVKSALYYPAAILLMTILSATFILTMVVPKFIELFKSVGAELPAITQFMIGISDFLKGNWYLIIIGIIAAIFGIKKFLKTHLGKHVKGHVMFRVPIFSGLFTRFTMANFSKILASLISSGLNLLTALEITEEVIDNILIKEVVKKARNRISKGAKLSSVLEQSKYFPKMLVQMIATGEESGEMNKLLIAIAGYYEKETKKKVDGLISLIEPIMIVFMAGVVGFLVVATILPLFSITQNIA